MKRKVQGNLLWGYPWERYQGKIGERCFQGDPVFVSGVGVPFYYPGEVCSSVIVVKIRESYPSKSFGSSKVCEADSGPTIHPIEI